MTGIENVDLKIKVEPNETKSIAFEDPESTGDSFKYVIDDYIEKEEVIETNHDDNIRVPAERNLEEKPMENPMNRTASTKKGKTNVEAGDQPKVKKRRKPPELRICPICGKSTRWLSEHSRIHSEVRPFKCEYCDKGFKTRGNLEIHKANHLNQRLHKCDICGKGYNYSEILKAHMLGHEGVRNHECTICGLKFVLRSTLNNHLSTHRQERRFECSVCNKRFLTQTDYKQHSWVHTGEKPHACTICDKRFRTAGMRRVHELNVHSDIFKKTEKKANTIRPVVVESPSSIKQ